MKSENDGCELPKEVVARCWCSKHKHRFGLVFERRNDENWELRHSYLINEAYQERECKELKIAGSFGIQDGYNGCKWCRAKGIFQCGECQSFNCHSNRFLKIVRCANCHARLMLSGTIRSFLSSND